MYEQKTVLVVAAHPDDEVLGCGGTLAWLAGNGCTVHILLMADGETSRTSDDEQQTPSTLLTERNDAAKKACTLLGCASVEILSLPDNRLDGLELLDLVKHIERFVRRFRPSTVLTHHSGDVNIDHRIVHEAVISATRPLPDHPVRELLFFEVASSTEWRPPSSSESFNPNWFVDISATLEKKIEALHAYKAEMREFPHPRSVRGIEALAHWRGATVGVEAAEAFVLGRKIIK